jgi:hypothetical protein
MTPHAGIFVGEATFFMLFEGIGVLAVAQARRGAEFRFA